MAEKDYTNKQMQPDSTGRRSPDEMDAATKSLSEALRVSFVILKVIMFVLVVIFLASGLKTVGSDEQALVLWFGAIRKVLGPGLHWIPPYPAGEIIRIPVAKKINLPISSFWYFETSRDLIGQGSSRIPDTLDPVRDGYCIIRSPMQKSDVTDITGSDYNIVHCKWQITYEIDDPELFFRNIYVDLESIPAGENYADVIIKEVTPFLQNTAGDAIVAALVNYTIDDVLFDRIAGVTEHVRRLLQNKLDMLQSGIKISSVQMTDKTWPRQVKDAFQAAISASQESQTAISKARTYAATTLYETAGPVAEKLFEALQDENVSMEQQELLWSELAGTARTQIDEALAYQTEVVQSARANADYLNALLPEYRKRPDLVVRQIYWDAIQRVLENADEKFIVQPTEDGKNVQIRVLLNRDPTLKPKSGKEQ